MKPFLLLLGILLSINTLAQTRLGKDYAVFFYVTDFQPGIPDIPFTKPEAKELAQELTDQYGFICEFVPECKAKDITDALERWNARLQPNDQVLFFFSMHGYYDANSDRGYLVPADGLKGAQTNYFRSWLSYDDLRTYLAPCRASHVLVALDACHAGSFGIRSNKKIPSADESSKSPDCATQIQNVLNIKGRQFLAAGKTLETAPGKSVFAQEILAMLRTGYDRNGILLCDDLSHRLQKLKKPEPESGSFVGHSGGGDFIFVRKDACGRNVNSNDRDGDGILNHLDKCPEVYGIAKFEGCPDPDKKGTIDSDYDGIPDDQDACPMAFGTPKARGCPDRDNDGVPDQSDACPNKAGELHWQGCPDSDGDGLPDHEDQCPDIKGLIVDKGCPPPDRDGDGVPDKADKCPDKAGKPYLEGCPEETPVPDDGLVRIPGGTFKMGCTSEQKDCDSDEKPVHEVTLSDYYIGKYEVTQKQWRAVMGSDPPELAFKGCDQCPVERVSWEDVQVFLQKLNTQNPGRNYRLPTEAEWEYAARGGKETRANLYAGGNTLDEVAWHGGNADSKTHPVGQKKANELGLHDMSGNVWEWCSDWKGEYPSKASTNPTGPTSGSYRVFRGGSWRGNPQGCRVANRSSNAPGVRSSGVGFRLARMK